MADDDNDKLPNIVSFDGDGPAPPDDDSDHHDDPDGRTDLVAIGFDEWTDAREALARLETRLESRNEDVRRAVDYARQLEEECDRLADVVEQTRDQVDEVHAELAEQRGRNAELRDQYQAVVEQLNKLSGIRGRYHLERNRREDAEAKQQQQADQIRQLQRSVEQLTAAIEEAREAGFSAELGALTIEWKR